MVKPRYKPCPITGVWTLQNWRQFLGPEFPMTIGKSR